MQLGVGECRPAGRTVVLLIVAGQGTAVAVIGSNQDPVGAVAYVGADGVRLGTNERSVARK
jgi:hypothetical protein